MTTIIAIPALALMTSGGNGAGPPWVGAVITIGILIMPVAAPHLTRTARKLLRPRKCMQCLGVGNNLCIRCKGRGKQELMRSVESDGNYHPYESDDPLLCQQQSSGGLFTGVPLYKCPTCEGRGRQLCMPCAGSGLSNHWLYTPVDRGAWGPHGS